MTDKEHLQAMASGVSCTKLDCNQCVNIFNLRVCEDAGRSKNGYSRYKKQEAKYILGTNRF